MSEQDERDRVAVVGAGFAQRYARAFQEADGADLVAICARRTETAQRAASALGCRAYADVGQMLEAEHPTVVVVDANDLHHPMAIEALEAGADVMCDKPLALDAQQAGDMTAYAARLGRSYLRDVHVEVPARLRGNQGDRQRRRAR